MSQLKLYAGKSWKDIIQALKENNCSPKLIYPAKLSFLIEGEIETSHNKEKLKEFSTTNKHNRRYLNDFYIEKKLE
jgi:hypothetical protein